ncbi:cell division protein [Klebsiella pneumoniae]|uniref:Cell division protein n=1 Tax=Klebsiella pneumoniae TaxID=573 RepID=A0A377VXM5_KLEPN|nr:cell division protein [Klebsiella pneumoniae]STW38320.1 cell division protein [Klebsiella pneumoniae]
MSLSRRQFIKASGVALCAGAAPLKAHAAGQQPALPVPPLLESRRGQPLFLTLQRSHWSFTPGTRAPVWGSMAAIWGRRSASGTETTSSLSTATA